jgi:hypothetical protein
MVLHASSSKPVGCLTVVLEGKPVEEFDAWGRPGLSDLFPSQASH